MATSDSDSDAINEDLTPMECRTCLGSSEQGPCAEDVSKRLDESSVQEPLQRLGAAAKQGDAEAIIKALDAGWPGCVDECDADYKTALMYASEGGHTKCVETLLQKGAQVNYMTYDGDSALMEASLGGHNECVEALLRGGAYVDIRDEDDFTALMGASVKGHSKCVEALLLGGAEVDIQDEDGVTALIMASLGGHIECVEALLVGGAQTNIQDKDHGMSALMGASIGGHVKCVEALLLGGAQLNIKGKDGINALMAASKTGNVECVKALLAAGADANIENKKQQTAEDLASENNHPEIVELLKSAQATPQPAILPAVPQSQEQNTACEDQLLSSVFRLEGYQNNCQHNYYNGKSGEVDHIIGLEMVSKAFSDAFKHQTIGIGLKVLCKIIPIVNGKYNLCCVSKFLKVKKASGEPSVTVSAYMKKMESQMQHVIKCILAIPATISKDIPEAPTVLQALVETFAQKLVGSLNTTYPSLEMDLNVEKLKDLEKFEKS